MSKSDPSALAEAQDDDGWSLIWAQSTFDHIPNPRYEDIEDSFGSALYPCFGAPEQRGDYSLQLIDPYETDEFLRGRSVPPTIDTQTMKDWISRCRHLHGEACTSPTLQTRPLSSTPITDLTVIDVDTLCLRSLPTGASYSALSYVWGASNRPTSLMSNQKAFRIPGGLDIKLPQTVRDAIDVTRALGMRFTWVDSLCIVQDDLTSKQVLIVHMDAIYSSATVTLVAATGTGADSGLSGWSALEDRNQPSVRLGEDFRLGVLPYYQREMLDCDHARRAWTYQETCLSQRCLVFLNGFVYFHCNGAVFAEHTNTDVRGILPEASANNLGKSEVKGSALRKYAQHVDSYTRRRLTFQADGLDAFKGIENALSGMLGVEKMYYGLPTSCFDWVLLWTGREKLQRRAAFPSWSWLGWIGDVTMPEPSDGGYEQTWLLRATWIRWYMVGIDGACWPLWDSTNGSYKISPLVSGQVLGAEEGRNSAEISGADDRGEAVDFGGEETSDEDDEGEQDPCPTYGHSTPQDPFGRSLHPEVSQMIRLPRNYDSTATSRPSSCTGIGALCFEAPVINVTIGSPQPAKAKAVNGQSVSLHDRQNRLCGFLSVPDCDSWSGPGGDTINLVLVSVTSCTDLSSHHYSEYAPLVYEACGMEYTLDDYLHSAVQPNVEFFDLLNVFALRKSERTANVVVAGNEVQVPIYERAGVGFIHRTALQSLHISWENIVLA